MSGVSKPSVAIKANSKRLNQVIAATLNMPEVREALRKQGYDAIPSTPEDAGQFIDREIPRYSKLVKMVRVRPD